MRSALVTLLLTVSLYAQQQGNIPHLVQAAGDLGNTPNPITSGNWYVGNWCWESSSVVTACTSCTDANGIIPSFTVGPVSDSAACVGNIFDPHCGSQQFWGKATSTGTPSISCSCTFPRQNLFTAVEIGGAITPDASNSGTSGTTNPSISVTSSQQNDVVISNVCQDGSAFNVPATSQNFATSSQTSDLRIMGGWFNAGAAGAQASNYNGFTNQSGVSLSAVAFKPTALTIATSLMPAGGVGSQYFACLKAYGGSGAYTWSITAGSLQSGLALTTDNTNCPSGTLAAVEGTPTAAGNVNLTFKVTDGTNNATQVLALNVTPTLLTIQPPVCTGFGTVPSSAAAINVKTGDMLLWVEKGDDRHGTTGYEMTTAANYADSLGNTFYRIPTPQAGGQGGALQIMTTTSIASGNDTPAYNSVGGSPLAGFMCDIAGAQQVVDDPVINQKQTSSASPTTLTSSIVTQVPNGLILSLAVLDCLATGGGSCTMSTSTNSPFSTVNTVTGFGGTFFSIYSQSAATTGSYSATSNYSDSTSANLSIDTPLQALVFLRPAPPTQTVILGEKKRRAY